jgi:NTP pyrophosphatase (non-canonical NTP hydrolase)
MNFNEYQEKAASTKNYPDNIGLGYAALGLTGEAGEVANKIKKVYRDNQGELSESSAQAIADELGDVLWYVSAMCDEIGVPLGEVAMRNLDKVASRKERGVIHGSGDQR